MEEKGGKVFIWLYILYFNKVKHFLLPSLLNEAHVRLAISPGQHRLQGLRPPLQALQVDVPVKEAARQGHRIPPGPDLDRPHAPHRLVVARRHLLHAVVVQRVHFSRSVVSKVSVFTLSPLSAILVHL